MPPINLSHLQIDDMSEEYTRTIDEPAKEYSNAIELSDCKPIKSLQRDLHNLSC